MNTYKVLLPLVVHTEDGSYAQGETFQKEFSVEDERTNLQSGLLEIVPSEWKVTGSSRVCETDPGDTFTHAFTLGEQELLVGVHIEAVQPAEPEKPARTRRKKED